MYDNNKLQEHIRDRLDLSLSEKAVAFVLSTYRNRDNGSCFPSQSLIARNLGLSRQHVNVVIKSLKEKRVLVSHKARFVGVRRKTITNYLFLFDKTL